MVAVIRCTINSPLPRGKKFTYYTQRKKKLKKKNVTLSLSFPLQLDRFVWMVLSLIPSISLYYEIYISKLSLFLNLHRCQVLYFVLKTLNESGHQHVYSAAEKPLHYAQSAAVLEVPDPTSFDFSELWTHTLLFVSRNMFLVGIISSFF